MRRRIRLYLLMVVLLTLGGKMIRLVYENITGTKTWANISGDYSRLSTNDKVRLTQEGERQRRQHGKPQHLPLPDDKTL